eukprot:1526745-Rhodomonas_salina.1
MDWGETEAVTVLDAESPAGGASGGGLRGGCSKEGWASRACCQAVLAARAAVCSSSPLSSSRAAHLHNCCWACTVTATRKCSRAGVSTPDGDITAVPARRRGSVRRGTAGRRPGEKSWER